MVLSGAAPRIAGSSKRSKSTAEAPAASVPNKPAQRPCTWKSGRHRMSRSVRSQPQAVSTDEVPARREACVWTAPLGLPVVPDVYTMSASSPGCSAGRETGSMCAASRSSCSTRSTVMPGPNTPARSSSQTATVGRGVAHHVGHLGGTGRRAEWYEHRAGPQHSQEGLDGPERGARAPEHPIARADTAGGQGGRQPRRHAVECRTVDDPRAVPPVEEHRLARASGPVPGPHLGERPPRRRRRTGGPPPRSHECPHGHRRHLIVWRS